MKAFKAFITFIKPLKAPQINENKNLTFILIQFSDMYGVGRVKKLFEKSSDISRAYFKLSAINVKADQNWRSV